MPLPLLALGAAQAGLGIYQGFKAAQIKPKRPTMEVQEETKEIAATYGQLAQGDVPGAKAAQEDIQATTSNLIQQSGKYTSSGANMLAVIAQAASGEARSKRQAEIGRQQTKLGLIDRYMGAKAAVGAEKKAAWDYNKRQLFEEEAAAKSQLSGAAIENVMGGARTMVGAGIMGGGGAGAGNVNVGTNFGAAQNVGAAAMKGFSGNVNRSKFDLFRTMNQNVT